MLVMSREGKVMVGVIRVCSSWLMSSVELVTLKACGRGVNWLIFWIKDLASL